ncbi:MAG TPA: hypothetical protein PLI89_02745 [Chitinophagales bacterium]|nr:hypothetical protein [Chitinophagales bacterium]HQU38758.1 hypothetical protein [Chitinophagales bacterium]HQU76606.1 hypothetical protein [Chitinophagales bacterium]
MPTKRLIVTPGINKLLQSGVATTVYKLLKGDVNENMKYGWYGQVGDKFYVTETCLISKDSTEILYENGDYARRVGRALDVSEGYSLAYHEAQALGWKEHFPNESPRWTARYWYEIEEITYPVRVQLLDAGMLEDLGIRQVDPNEYEFAEIKVTARNITEAWRAVWNHTHNRWKTHGSRDQFVSYPFKEEDKIPSPKGMSITDHQWVTNPFIQIYKLKVL